MGLTMSTKTGKLSIPAGLAQKSRAADWAAQNTFYERVCALAREMSRQEAAVVLGVSLQWFKNYCYDNDVTFESEPRKVFAMGGAEIAEGPTDPKLVTALTCDWRRPIQTT